MRVACAEAAFLLARWSWQALQGCCRGAREALSLTCQPCAEEALRCSHYEVKMFPAIINGHTYRERFRWTAHPIIQSWGHAKDAVFS